MYKMSNRHFSQLKNKNMVDIYIKKRILGIPYCAYHETILDVGQAEEVVYLLNNPSEMDKRLKEAAKKVSI